VLPEHERFAARVTPASQPANAGLRFSGTAADPTSDGAARSHFEGWLGLRITSM